MTSASGHHVITEPFENDDELLRWRTLADIHGPSAPAREPSLRFTQSLPSLPSSLQTTKVPQ